MHAMHAVRNVGLLALLRFCLPVGMLVRIRLSAFLCVCRLWLGQQMSASVPARVPASAVRC